MNVTLPDGTVLRDVPDGTTKAELTAKLKSNGYDVSKLKTPVPTGRTMKQEMEEQTTSDTGTALKTGIATAASKGVRGIASLLPNAMAAWGEKHGIVPSEADIKLLEQGTAASPTAQGAELAGEIALTAAPGAAGYKLATAGAKALPVARRIAANAYGNAAIGGAGAGAAASKLMGADPWEGATVGFTLGPAGTLIGNVGGKVFTKTRDLFRTPEELAVRQVHKWSHNAERDAAILRNLEGAVPGELPTSGMAATVDPQMLYVKEMEEQARRRLGAEFVARDQTNQAARQAVLEPMAMRATRYPGETLSEAEALRQRVSAPLYARAAEDRIRLAPELDRILRGAEVQPAARAGERGFSQMQTNAGGRLGGPQGEVIPPSAGSRIIRDPLTGEIVGHGPLGPFMPQPATRSVQDLQKTRFELDKQIAGLQGATDSAGKAQLARLSEARRQLTQEMEGQSGNFATANTIFRNYSEPVNQGKVAGALLDALRSPTGTERAASFMSAMQNAPRTLQRADMSPRFQHLQEVMNPEQMATINALRNSVRREADYAALPRMDLPGVRSPVEEVRDIIPSYISRGVSALKLAMQKVGATSDEQVTRILDEAALNPSKMAALLEKLPPTDRIKFMSAMREYNPKGASTGVISGANNAP